MLAICLTAGGLVAASSGLMLWATADVIIGDHDLMYDSGVILMIAGTIVAIIGGFWYKANETRAEQAVAARSSRET